MNGYTITIDEGLGERVAATYHTGNHKPFSIVWKVSPGRPIDYIHAIFWRSWREAAKAPSGCGKRVAETQVSAHQRTHFESDSLILSAVHMVHCICDFMRCYPNATYSQILDFAQNAFDAQGGNYLPDALRAGLAAASNTVDVGEYNYFRLAQLQNHLPDVLRLRGQVVN